MRKLERNLAVVALATIAIAWLVGMRRHEADLSAFLSRTLPGASEFQACQAGIFAGIDTSHAGQQIVGYVAIGEADGYGGPMRVAVGVSPAGIVDGITIVDHQETAAYFRRAQHAGLPKCLVGKAYSDSFSIGHDVDAVTGATRTAGALAGSVRTGARRIAGAQLDLPLPPVTTTPVKFGLPEITLLCLYALGFASYARRLKWKKQVRWVSLVIGLIVLGFMYNAQLTLTNVNSLLLGYWPSWQIHIYWYLLVLGVLFVPLLTGKDPYCSSICPFGAAQQCLAAIGNAKPRIRPGYRAYLRWAPRLLAWVAVLLALVYRNPSVANYEVYGALFHVVGSFFQFGLLAVVLVASLFITRPWCNYLCPVHAVTDFLRFGRKWVRLRLDRS